MQTESSTPAPLNLCSPGLAKLLVRLRIASEQDVRGAIEQGGSYQVIRLLADRGLIKETDALERIARDLSLPIVDPTKISLRELRTSFASFEGAEGSWFFARRCLILKREGRKLLAILSDPLDSELVSQIEFVFQEKVELALGSEAKILAAIDLCHTATEISRALEDENLDQEARQASRDIDLIVSELSADETVQQGSQAAPVVKLVTQILSGGVRSNASDIHFEPKQEDLDVRLRVDGVMLPFISIPKRLQPYVLTRLKILSGMDITIRNRPQDGRFRMRFGEKGAVDARVSSVPTPFGEKLVLRLLIPDSQALALGALGMSDEVLNSFRRVLSGSERVVLVSGPTGSGKTTTLYSAIMHLKTSTTNIVTIEDPIEFRIEGITQIQVDNKVDVTFASALRSVLRQDPDIILVGEIRDSETAEIVCQAAQTGHLVLSTIHTNSASGAVVRLLDLGVEPFIMATSLGAVMAQRLVRRLCDNCAAPLRGEEARMRAQSYGMDPSLIRVPVGCDACDGQGYRGRIGIYSLLVVDGAVRDAIRKGASESEIAAIGRAQGMKELFEAGLELVQSGITTIEEIERVASAAEGFTPTRKPSAALRKSASAAASASEIKGKRGAKESLAGLVRKSKEEKAAREVLIIDDDEGIRAVLTRVLVKEGYLVHQAPSGKEAIEFLNSSRPDVILCDLMMPQMSGDEFLRTIKASQEFSSIPVIMLTASDSEGNEIALLRAGADDFVSKASSPALILTRLKRLLRLDS